MPIARAVGAPSVAGVSNRFGDAAVGAIAGASTNIATKLLGPFGFLTPLVVASMIRGQNGATLAMLSGYQFGQSLNLGGLIGGSPQGQARDFVDEVM